MERIRLYECLARIGKLVESPERIRIVDALCQADRSVESLSGATDLPVKTVSHHLQKLKRDGFVASQKSGRFVIYSIAGNEIAMFLEQLKHLSEILYPEIRLSLRNLRENRGLLDESAFPVNPVLIDVRPLDEFLQAHIPDAISVPFEKFQENMKSIPTGRPVIAYCRDKYCDLADQAVEMLKQSGYDAWRMEDSVSARIAETRPLETGKEKDNE